MSDATAKFKDLFLAEADDQLALLASLLLEIEKDPTNREMYQSLMRSAHTVKGSAATMGYSALSSLAHSLEDIFRACETGTIALDKNAVDIALSAADRMKESLRSIKDENKETETNDLVSRLAEFLAGATTAQAGSTQNVVPQGEPPAAPPEKEFIYTVPSSIRVDVERLNALMGLFEEMLMVRLKLDTILEPAQALVRTITDPAVKQRIYFLDEFKTLFGALARSLSDMQSELLRVRLVPLEQLFTQFPRMVRDLAQREKKEVKFEVVGGDVALDRTVLEGLGGALAHLLRNAVDHGIATSGTVRLVAKRVNDRVHVIVEDDGVGIDHEAIRTLAVARGLIGADDAELLRKNEIADLLFHKNISTSPTVTDISGRGVGLSAVRAFAQEVGGRVSVFSPIAASGGTRFVLDLPVSLATVEVLLVESSGFTFAIPFANVVHTVNFPEHAIVSSVHQESVVIDEKLVPLLRLDHILKITFAAMLRPKKATDTDERLAVLLRSGEREVALLVDRCVGEQELLVKSLPPLLRDVKGFSGSALLPDGRTILLLDAQGLLTQAFNDILEQH